MERREEEEEEEEQRKVDLVCDRFRLSVISICESEAKKNGMEIAEPVVACVSDLAFNFSEQLAKDLELFARHAGRKTVNMEDVILSGKEPQTERKRKKSSKKDSHGLDV